MVRRTKIQEGMVCGWMEANGVLMDRWLEMASPKRSHLLPGKTGFIIQTRTLHESVSLPPILTGARLSALISLKLRPWRSSKIIANLILR